MTEKPSTGPERADDADVSEAAAPAPRRRPVPSVSMERARGAVARVVWVACFLIALVLASAAFSYALDANANNDLVKAVRHLADLFDLGWFDLDNPVWAADPDGPNALTKTALANYGAAAVAYLVVGRILERLIRP
ncbi:hypothetical protein [Nocardioides sp. GY 10113]|uniref:hypothetical protein n=1 Tax=Nocardioides sp. GY 10113 TaxID=2569761 RepID=UPI001F0FB384|nr:hypothetical protein [Nocardioides sp. GY 10113]